MNSMKPRGKTSTGTKVHEERPKHLNHGTRHHVTMPAQQCSTELSARGLGSLSLIQKWQTVKPCVASEHFHMASDQESELVFV